MYQDLNTCHDWPDKKAIVNLPIKLKGNLKRISDNCLSPLGDKLGAQSKEISAASQALLETFRF